MTVYEAEVPGVGKKFELETRSGERLIVLIHHDGKREVYRRPEEGADSERLFGLSDSDARTFGSIIEGAHFQPVDLDEVQVPLGEAIIEWVEVGERSPVAGTTLGEADLRSQTGASVIAIQRGEETLPNPEPSQELRSDDILVSLGTREEQSKLEALVTRTED
jgi:TrkA domain protein